MAKFKNAMEIFKLLEKSNCRECNEKTCLAFAGAVFQGKKELRDCPRLSPDIIHQYGDRKAVKSATTEQEMEAAVLGLKKKITEIDLPVSAERLGGTFANGKLTIKILGKDVHVDTQGNLYSDIHLHPWLTIPLLSYIIHSSGVPVSGKWVPFRELKNGKTWAPLFGQRCEKPLKKVADTYTDLFEDMMRLFNGRQVDKHYNADISLVLHPLPRVPMLICYWKPDEGLESDLNLFFDSTAEENLSIESIFALGTGLVRMFEKISLRHGYR